MHRDALGVVMDNLRRRCLLVNFWVVPAAGVRSNPQSLREPACQSLFSLVAPTVCCQNAIGHCHSDARTMSAFASSKGHCLIFCATCRYSKTDSRHKEVRSARRSSAECSRNFLQREMALNEMRGLPWGCQSAGWGNVWEDELPVCLSSMRLEPPEV